MTSCKLKYLDQVISSSGLERTGRACFMEEEAGVSNHIGEHTITKAS